MRFRRPAPSAEPEDVAALGRELVKLDPWAFWTVRLEPEVGASFVVLGVTGAFVTAPNGLEGYLVAEGRKLIVDGRPLGGFREAKRAARWLRGKLLGIGASSAEVTPAIVLTRARAGAPREHAGVLVLRPEDVVPTITARERILDPTTAERLATRIGTPIARRPPAEPED
jgi:hypothetical protein